MLQDARRLLVAPRPHHVMTSQAQLLADFRSQITKLLQERDREWEASRHLIEASRFADTVKRLLQVASHTDLPPAVRESIATALKKGNAQRIQDLPGSRLKELTGLPPSKAVRALCVWFDLVEPAAARWPIPSMDALTIASFVREHRNPFDLLLTADVASVLDLGAGDLSFAADLAELYAPRIRQQGRSLVLHCLDRLNPRSKLGGPLHPGRDRLEALRSQADLSFQFIGDQDMCVLEALDQSGRLAPRYTIATCWAPATPTFAYEPTRLSAEVIEQELRRTKGPFRQTRYAGEPALEVQHGDRALLFPPWKFEVRGPLVLLDILARRGQLCILGAVDSQVYWELLAQLLEEPRFRPSDQPFSPENLASYFGDVYRKLTALAIGETLDLSTCAALRAHIPRVLPAPASAPASYRFLSIHISRGAVFPNMPASSTARQFLNMVEETPPWMLVLVPDQSPLPAP